MIYSLEGVIKRVEKINEMRGDDEMAHLEEDRLHQDVLRYIYLYSADNYARHLAGEALKTKDIKFARWCA